MTARPIRAGAQGRALAAFCVSSSLRGTAVACMISVDATPVSAPEGTTEVAVVVGVVLTAVALGLASASSNVLAPAVSAPSVAAVFAGGGVFVAVAAVVAVLTGVFVGVGVADGVAVGVMGQSGLGVGSHKGPGVASSPLRGGAPTRGMLLVLPSTLTTTFATQPISLLAN